MNHMRRLVLVLGLLALAVTSACTKEPDQATIHRDLGNKLLNDSKWEQAAAEYALSLQADPKQEKIWEKKAYCYMQAGKLDDADIAILKTLDFRAEADKKAEVYRNLASMYLTKGPSEKAESYFLKAVETDPKDDLSLAWLGEIYAQRGGARASKAPAVPSQLDKAIGYYDKVIAIKPELPNTYLNKRIALAKYMEYEKIQKNIADQEVAVHAKDVVKTAEAKALAEQHQARFDDFKKQMDEATKKFAEAQKSVKPK